MNIKEYKNTWVRIAANGRNIKEGSPFGWRCSVKNDGKFSDEISLTKCVFNGIVTSKNVIFGNDPNGTPGLNGVIAWVDAFGDLNLEDDALVVNLLEPQ